MRKAAFLQVFGRTFISSCCSPINQCASLCVFVCLPLLFLPVCEFYSFVFPCLCLNLCLFAVFTVLVSCVWVSAVVCLLFYLPVTFYGFSSSGRVCEVKLSDIYLFICFKAKISCGIFLHPAVNLLEGGGGHRAVQLKWWRCWRLIHNTHWCLTIIWKWAGGIQQCWFCGLIVWMCCVTCVELLWLLISDGCSILPLFVLGLTPWWPSEVSWRFYITSVEISPSSSHPTSMQTWKQLFLTLTVWWSRSLSLWPQDTLRMMDGL